MSRASGCLWLAVGLVLALAAGGIAFITLQRATVARQAGPALTKPAVVAGRPVEPGALLSEADLTIQNFPAEALPAGAVSSLAGAVGKITMIALNTGEMLLDHHLTQPDISTANLGFTLPAGKVAVTLSADDLLSRSQLTQVGSRVDILYSLEVPASAAAAEAGDAGGSGDKQQFSFGALQNVIIVGALRSGGADGGKAGALGSGGPAAALTTISAYVLALEPQDALVLKYLKDAGAVMDLALRNNTDEIEHEMQPVELQYLIDRFQLLTR